MIKKFEIIKKFTFEAAHHLPNYNGKDSLVHGHRYEFEIYIEGKVTNGMIIDIQDFKTLVEDKIVNHLDHSDLNNIIDYPTMENVLVWIIDQIGNDFQKKNLKVNMIRIWETPNNSVIMHLYDK